MNVTDSPSVFGADEQHDVEVDVPRWVRLAQLVLDEERVIERLGPDVEMSLLFVDEQTIAELNERFLGGDGPTDVLAFPIDDELPPAAASPIRADAARVRRPIRAIRPRCWATWSCARGRGPPGGRAGDRRPTTRSRCSSCTVCCTCSTTTTPNRRDGGDAAPRAGAPRALPRARAERG